MIFLNEDDILQALTLDDVITCVEEALEIYEDGTFVMPERMAVPTGDKN
jgi:ornithine cyclodeaminase/alanine dehydrogenase-like protein (mu-crystallin family)